MGQISFLNKFLLGLTVGTGAAIVTKRLMNSSRKYTIGNKVALVTGGSRGLGLLLAKELASEGAKVVICAREGEELQSAAAEIRTLTRNIHTIVCDITEEEEVKRMVHETEEVFGPVEILVNNASIISLGPMESMTNADYDQAMKVHFWGPYHLMHEVLPGMIQRKEGRIVNIASIGGKISFPHLLPYNASKYALSGLSEGMCAELAEKRVKVTTVYPGLMQTGSPRNINVKGNHEKEYAWFKITSSIPFISMDAERSAKKIVRSMIKGKKVLMLTFPAKLALVIHGIAPELNITLFDLINRALPHGTSKEVKKGYESESGYSSNPVTASTEEAALHHNER